VQRAVGGLTGSPQRKVQPMFAGAEGFLRGCVFTAGVSPADR
jgi:hypothetical protein